jgi:hypothetical protein
MQETTTASPLLSHEEALDLVRLAVLAPSGHNTQPWRFELGADRIVLRPDLSRRLPVVDPDDHALYISLGAALENLVIAARQRSLGAEVAAFAAEAPDAIVVRLRRSHGNEPGREAELFAAIPERQSTRRDYDGRPIPAAILQQLRAAGSGEPGVTLRTFAGPGEVEQLVPFVEQATRTQIANPSFVAELLEWMRFGSEGRTRGDGLVAAAFGMPPVPRRAGEFVMRRLLSPDGEARRAVGAVRSSSALALFATDRHDRAGWVAVGRSFERLALAATAAGVKHAHVNMPCEVVEVREQLRSHLGLGSAQPLLLVRLGFARWRPRSPRRELAAVIGR